MALLTCPDCGGNVSDSAPACPHCGRPMKATGAPAPKAPAPKPKANASGCLGVILLAVIIFIVIGAVTGSGDKASDSTAKPSASEQAETAKKAEEDKACRQDLSCIAEKHLADAAVYCKDPIEARAAHDVKWTDGTFELKMSRYRWSDAAKTAVTYIGDKVAFQNGFGAFTPMTYFCTLDVDHDVVTDVQVIEGRLPPQ